MRPGMDPSWGATRASVNFLEQWASWFQVGPASFAIRRTLVSSKYHCFCQAPLKGFSVSKTYGQYCGLARALDLVGGRWSLLIVRDLLTGPKRFGELEQGLPGIATNVLASRLRELEKTGLVRRSLLGPGSSSVVYELTPYGRELQEPLVALGRWGARLLGEPKAGDTFSSSSFAIGLLATFRPDKAGDGELGFEFRFGDPPLRVAVSRAQLSFPSDPTWEPRVVFASRLEVLIDILAGGLDLDHALASGRMQIEGPKRDARRFFEIFSWGPVGPNPDDVRAGARDVGGTI
jgi:DNA-binding HxlR family transcriptional regulator